MHLIQTDHRESNVYVYIYNYIYIRRTQMTLVLLGKSHVLGVDLQKQRSFGLGIFILKMLVL